MIKDAWNVEDDVRTSMSTRVWAMQLSWNGWNPISIYIYMYFIKWIRKSRLVLWNGKWKCTFYVIFSKKYSIRDGLICWMHSTCIVYRLQHIEEVPNCFLWSSLKFERHTGQKIDDFDRNCAFPDCNSSLTSPMYLKWCTKVDIA